MEVIKKTVKMAMTVSGITDSDFVIVPDLNTSYNFKILLTSQVHDIGFFDNVESVDYVQGFNNVYYGNDSLFTPIGFNNLLI
jgi:hypothetical protein